MLYRENERTSARTNERANARTNECTNERTKASTNKCTNGRSNARTNKRTNERNNDRSTGLINESENSCFTPTFWCVSFFSVFLELANKSYAYYYCYCLGGLQWYPCKRYMYPQFLTVWVLVFGFLTKVFLSPWSPFNPFLSNCKIDKELNPTLEFTGSTE